MADAVFTSRAEAQKVLDSFSALIKTNGFVSVDDANITLGVTPNVADENMGWVSIAGMTISLHDETQSIYLLILPSPKVLV